MSERLDSLRAIFEKLSEFDLDDQLPVTEELSGDNDDWYCLTSELMREKLYGALACAVYPAIRRDADFERALADCVVMPVFFAPEYFGDEIRDIVDGRCRGGEKYYDLVYRATLMNSYPFDVVAYYYKKARTWEYRVLHTQFEEFNGLENPSQVLDAFMDGRIGMEDVKMLHYLDAVFGDFLEEGAKAFYETFFDEGNPIYYMTESEFDTPSMLCMKSYLLPHYKKVEDRVKAERPELSSLLESCIDVLLSLFTKNKVNQKLGLVDPNLEAAYFFQIDYFLVEDLISARNNINLGFYALKFRFLIAGELIDEILYELDRDYHFLPEKLKRSSHEQKKEEEEPCLGF